MATALRFAILCRVSTETQEKEGESLAVQEKRLRECVQLLNGTIVKEYIGQEHSTEGHERPILDELLNDAQKHEFNALMVFDLSRLTRDPLRSKVILAHFKKYGIRLFVQAQEHNLNSPETALYTGIMSEFNAFQAAIQNRKAILSKIERAKRGWYVGGKMPYGRRLVHQDKSKPAEWEVIPEVQKFVDKLYDLYVNQKMYHRKLSKLTGLSQNKIRLILTEYATGVWRQKFDFEEIHENIETPIPPLLTEEQLERVKQVSRTNKQFNSRKNFYALGSFIKCGMCGLSYHGTAYTTKNKAGSTLHRYYVHSEQFRSDVCFKTIQADMIESACFRAISFVFSSTENLKRAIERALTNGSNRKEDLHEQIEHLRSCLTELNSEKNRLIKAMVKGVVNEDDIASEMTRIRKETIEIEQQLKEQIEYLAKLEVDLPDDLHVRVQAVIAALTEQEGTNMLEWSEESLSRLLQWFFGVSKDNGIYIKRDEENNVCFQIKGVLSCSTLGVVEESRAGIMLAGLDDLNQTFDHTSTQADFNDLIQKCLDSKTNYS